MSGGRSTLSFIWNNFRNSIKKRQKTGNLMGTDYFGNKYFEIPAQPQIGKRRAERWFEPSEKRDENFDRELTAEWESWLRHRRIDPPTDEELKRNLAIMQMKKVNAAKLDVKYGKAPEAAKTPQHVTGSGNFPKYDEYETVAGKRPDTQPPSEASKGPEPKAINKT